MAILKVTAVPDFGALDGAITNLQSKPIVITAKTQSAVENIGKIGNAAKEAGNDVLHVTRAFDALLKAQSKGFVEEEEAIKAATQAAEQYIRTWEQAQKRLAASAPNTSIQNRINQMFVGLDGTQPKSAAASAQVFERAFSNLDEKVQKTEKDLGKAANTVKEFGEEEKRATGFTDLMGDSFLRIAAKMYIWQVLGNIISSVRRSFYEALDTMKAVDDELVTVRKVTGASTEELKAIEEQAYNVASAYGVEANAYLESVAAFARAGYKEKASDLAELSTKVQIVGDTTAEVANQMLLSVDAAYKYGGSIEALSKVLDGANEIDNKYATSIEKISEGLGIVAPVAAQVHVGINELTAAIGTVTAVTQRSGSEAARALRALFLNIVGDTKTEIDEGVTWTTGEIAGLRDVIKLYAKDAYDAAEATGSVINPMEAIAGLSKSMKEGLLTEQQLMQMVSDIGGKLRTSQLLALIQNWDMYQSMLQDYAGAIGSADREVENALDSWTRKSNQLKNAWTEFINNLVDTRLIKDALDFIIDEVNLLNKAIGGTPERNAYYGRRMEYMLDEEHGSGQSVAEHSLELLKAQIELGKSAEDVAKQFKKEYEEIQKYKSATNEMGEAVYELIDADKEFSQIYYNYVIKPLQDAEDALRAQELAQKQLRISASSDATAACNVIVEGETEKLAAINMTTAAVYDQVDALALLAHKAYVARRMEDSNGGDTLSEIERSWNASAEGQYWGNAILTAGRARSSRNNIKGNGDDGGDKKTPKTPTSTTATKSKASILQSFMKDVLEKEKEKRDAEIAAIDEQIEALKDEYNLEKQSLELEEKKADVLKKQNDLLLAQQERTIRIYNAKTGQWEWIADATKVRSAEEALKKSKEALEEYKRKISLDEAVQELQDRKKAIQEAYNVVEAQWKAAVKSLEEPAYDMADVISILNTDLEGFDDVVKAAMEYIQNATPTAVPVANPVVVPTTPPTTPTTPTTTPTTPTNGAKSGGNGGTQNPPTGFEIDDDDKYDKDEKPETPTSSTPTFGGTLPQYANPNESSTDDPSMEGHYSGPTYGGTLSQYADPNEVSYDDPSLMDEGGVLYGLGGIKATGANELVVPPSIASRMLNPSADSIFRQRMGELGFMYGATTNAPATLMAGGFGSVTNNNGSTYNLGGISLTEGQARTTTVYELAQLAHNLRVCS